MLSTWRLLLKVVQTQVGDYFIHHICTYISSDNNDESVVVGGLYNPALQSDYGGNIFAHEKAKLKAHPFYDKRNNVIKPWTLPTTLRAGTLIVFEATFHCFIYGKRKVQMIFSLSSHLTT